MELTETQKKFLIDNQDRFTIEKFGRIFKTNGMKVFEYYSDMVDSGEFKKYYVNPLPHCVGRKGFQKNEQRDERESEQEDGEREGHFDSELLR